MSENVSIKVNGSIYDGWTKLTLNKSIENLSGGFDISSSTGVVMPISPADSLTILLHGQPIIQGYIDAGSVKSSSSNRVLQVKGRDFAGDLVDCSAVTKTNEFSNITFKDLVNKLIEPFGMSAIFLSSNADKVIKKVSIQQEPVYDILESEARKVGVLVYSDYNGSLVVADIGSSRINTTLEMPGNVVQATASVDYSQRYSEYIVKAQQSSDDDLEIVDQTQVKASAQDLNMPRYRPLIIIGESEMNLTEAKTRAEWEAATRAARSEEISCRVDSWLDADSRLWEINTLVSVRVQQLNLQTEMVIKSVTYSLNNQDGAVCDLVLTHKDSLVPEPVVSKKDGLDVII